MYLQYIIIEYPWLQKKNSFLFLFCYYSQFVKKSYLIIYNQFILKYDDLSRV